MADSFIKPPFFQWGVKPVASRGLGEAGAPLEDIAGVHFNGFAAIEEAAMVGADATAYSFAFWFRTEFSGSRGIFQFFVLDYDNNDNGLSTEGTSFDPGFTFQNSTGASFVIAETDHPVAPSLNGAWHHCLGAVDITTQTAAIYIDGVNQTTNLNVGGAGGTITINGAPILLGTLFAPDTNFWVGDYLVADLAQFWFAPNQNLLSGGIIPAATVARFYDPAGPISYGPTGALPTGTQPEVFLNIAPGDPATDFYLNRGVGADLADAAGVTSSLRLSQTNPPAVGPPFDFPTIAGVPNVGELLSIDQSNWPRPILNVLETTWRSNGFPFPNAVIATTPTYVVAAGQNGFSIWCEVVFEDAIGVWCAPTWGVQGYVPIGPDLADTRVTDDGDTRITDSADTRITSDP